MKKVTLRLLVAGMPIPVLEVPRARLDIWTAGGEPPLRKLRAVDMIVLGDEALAGWDPEAVARIVPPGSPRAIVLLCPESAEALPRWARAGFGQIVRSNELAAAIDERLWRALPGRLGPPPPPEVWLGRRVPGDSALEILCRAVPFLLCAHSVEELGATLGWGERRLARAAAEAEMTPRELLRRRVRYRTEVGRRLGLGDGAIARSLGYTRSTSLPWTPPSP